MYGKRAFELIKELERTPDTLPPYNDQGVLEVLEEIQALFTENQKDSAVVLNSQERDESRLSSMELRHAALERNKRCLLAYLHNRLQRIRRLRWEFGIILPHEIKVNLSAAEFQWFTQYSRSLAVYMADIGGRIEINLLKETKPPKEIYIQVKCLKTMGSWEFESGTYMLRAGNFLLLPRSDCEPLIRQGVLQHVTNDSC